MDNAQLNTAVEGALKAFEGIKDMVADFDKKLTEIAPKMDAFDQDAFKKMAEDVGKGIEESQKATGRAKALEEQNKVLETGQKALEAELTSVKTALNRVPAGGLEEKGKELAALRTKAFNDFARSKGKEDFTDYLAKRAESEPELKALSVNSDVSGGYLVTPELGAMVTTKVFETSPIRQLASVTTIGSDSYEVVVDYDEAGAGWVGETAARTTTTTPVIGKVSIPVNELYANPKASQKILEDASIDMEAWLTGKVVDIFARTEATAFVTGSGSMRPKGIMSYDSGTTLSSSQVEQVNSGHATLFTYDGLVNLQNALKEEYQSNAVFMIKRATNATLMQIKDGEGRPIFNMTFDKNVGLQPTIMGKPVYFANDVAAVAASALAMAYGDFKRAYQIVDRRGITVLRDPYSDKPNVAFYTTKRVGGGAVNFEAYKIQKISA